MRYYKANKIVDYCLEFSYVRSNPDKDTLEWTLLRGMIHFMGGFFVMEEDVPFHFIYSMRTSENYIYSRHPVKLSSSQNILRLFQREVWLAILVSLLILSLAFLIIFKFYKKFLPNEDLCINNEKDDFEFFLLTFSSITEPDALPFFTSKSNAGKILLGSWVLAILILNLAFTCNLRATLLKPSLEKPINSMQDVEERGENLWAVHNVADPLEPDKVNQYYLDFIARDDIRDYIESNGKTTFFGNDESYLTKDVIKDIVENGASWTFYVSLQIVGGGQEFI